MHYHLAMSSYQESLKILESDIEHANSLAAAIPTGKSGASFQMKLVSNNLAPFFLVLLQWIDCSCFLPRYLNLFHVLVYKVYADGSPNRTTHGRKATIREFYGVILPSLQRLHGNLEEFDEANLYHPDAKALAKKKFGERGRFSSSVDVEREEECGICLEPCAKVVLPNCCHAMCIKCYRNWNTKSESCPFCRRNIKRVNSEDLWVLTCDEDVVDQETAIKEDLLQFHLYVSSLPKDYPDDLFAVYYEYML